MRIKTTNYFGLHSEKNIKLTVAELETLKKARDICAMGFLADIRVNDGWSEDDRVISAFGRAECELDEILADFKA